MSGHPFAEGEVDALGMVDEQAQRLASRLLEGNQVKARVDLPELALDVILQVFHSNRSEKKVGQAHFSYTDEDEKA